MDIKLLAAGAGMLLTGAVCPPPTDTVPTQVEQPPTTTAPAPLPCTGEVVLITELPQYPGCDMNPPQVLAAILDDDPADWDLCSDFGGQVLHDPSIDRFYCINIDY